MASGWKEFQFFDATPVRDPSPEDSPLYSDSHLLEIVSNAASAGEEQTAFLSTRGGAVKEFNADMQLVSQLQAIEPDSGRNIDFLRVVPGMRLVLTVTSLLGRPFEISVWDLNKGTLHARSSVTNGTNTFPATAFCMAPDLSVLVMGFADGSVVAVRGDLLRDKGTRQRLIHNSGTGITGLALVDSGNQVYVSSVNQVLIVSTTTSRNTEVLDKARGADLGCTSKAEHDQLLVARDSDLAWFNPKHRGPTIELPVTCKQIYLMQGGKYLVAVAAVAADSRSLLVTQSLRLMIFDLHNHVLGYNTHLANGVKAIFEQWGRLNIVASNGLMYVIREKPLDARIALLKARKLYQVAIKMAEEADTNRLKLTLHQDFADYLFSKNDTDAALKEYIAAIDLGQSSRAIRHFKDSQHAATLLQYLNALFERGFATPQHITLQIICFTKLDKFEELSSFLRSALRVEGFEFERAVSVLNEMPDTRYTELAAFIAEQWPDPDLVVQIRLRNMDDVQSTLDYIQTVSVADALRILIQNSRLLLNKLPVETTAVLITLFTGKFVSKPPRDDPTHKDSRGDAGKEADTPVLQSYQAFMNFLSSTSYLGSHIVSAETLEAEVAEPSYLPPRPRLIFPSFIGHDNEFVIFLEACLNSAPVMQSSEKDLSDIATTLFEMYLQVDAKDKASELLDTHASELYQVNVQNAAQVHQFKLSASQQVALGSSYAHIFRRFVEDGNIDAALSIFYEHADEDADLVAQSIRLLSSDEKTVASIRAKSPAEFDKICRKSVDVGTPPIQLMSKLSQSPFVTIGDIKPFIEQCIKSTEDQASRHLKLATAYENELEEKREALQKEEQSSLVFQYNNCKQCDQQLEPPATHFACQHSYHQQCIEPDGDCPSCVPDLENMEQLRAQIEETSAQEDYFLSELSSRQDKMKVVLDFISRGGLSSVH